MPSLKRLKPIMAVFIFVSINSTTHAFEWPGRWKVPCRQVDPSNRKRIEKMVKDTVLIDLQQLAKLNPDVIPYRFRIARQEQIMFRCLDPSPADASASTHNTWFGSYIRMGKAWTGERTLSASRSLIFHELLHALKLDNFPTGDHNSVEFRLRRDSEGVTFQNKDLVYACHRTIFPEFLSDIYINGRSYSSCVIKDVHDSCVSCLAAKLDPDGHPYVPPNAFKRADLHQKCMELHQHFREGMEAAIQESQRRGLIKYSPENC